MRRLEFFVSIFLLIFSIVVCRESYKLSLIGPLRTPGPGLFPFILCVTLFVLSCLYFFKTLMALWRKQEIHLWRGLRWGKVILVLAILFSYVLLLEKGGFLFCTYLLLLSLFQWVDKQRWFWVYGGSLGITFIFYAVFKIWLKIQLPMGFLRI
jgi:hypothetical protein